MQWKIDKIQGQKTLFKKSAPILVQFQTKKSIKFLVTLGEAFKKRIGDWGQAPSAFNRLGLGWGWALGVKDLG